jgi:hypothetical protein
MEEERTRLCARLLASWRRTTKPSRWAMKSGRVVKISMRTIAIENIDGNASFLSDSIFRISSVIIKKEHSIQGTREEPI